MSDQNDFWTTPEDCQSQRHCDVFGQLVPYSRSRNLKDPATGHLVKAKFHYTILVAQGPKLVTDLSQTC